MTRHATFVKITDSRWEVACICSWHPERTFVAEQAARNAGDLHVAAERRAAAEYRRA